MNRGIVCGVVAVVLSLNIVLGAVININYVQDSLVQLQREQVEYADDTDAKLSQGDQEDDEYLTENWSKNQLSGVELNCLLADVKCDKRLSDVKDTLHKAFQDNCATCSQKQRIDAGKVMAILLFKQPKAWKKLLVKYDVNNNLKSIST